ncbi:MAG TPA: tRNA uridine-5-carboxymethylaminomethyl(34) synthesis GTPase MnmE [Lachnospiraceae bacterium]|nr:tRNA uridine-5-carboxymethylaminomethyl(34) synthesis GTPase MnmE [Lachnospiraceae bacterium]HPF28559.1 tRNA uridine-5-carboxymethylaminomethyl(34) synthesis GTPase MnmE [Lachnospiraceae bacterium]
MKTDTIAAIATGMTDAGIGIVRISGEGAQAVAEEIFRSKVNTPISERKSHTMNYGMIFDDGNAVDEVLLSIMRAPHSYTGEDTVEINCHGGMYIVQKILEVVLKHGARLAMPGEFTKRAFLNGKMDLSKAEAVMDLIHSKNEWARKNSMNQMQGKVFEEIKELRSQIIYEVAFIESALDDPEHISLDDYPKRLGEKLQTFAAKLTKMIENSKNGRIRKDGINTVIVGRPNAGKSSLLNVIAREERAIVTDIEGTTRDVLEESVTMGNLTLNLVDTAGIRDTENQVEQIGVSKARKYAEDADLLLYVVDASLPLNENDDSIIEMIIEKEVVILLNKSDLCTVVTKEELEERFGRSVPMVNISARNEEGMEELTNTLEQMFLQGKRSLNEDIVITNLRQSQELIECLDSIHLVQKSVEDGMPEDFFSIDLTNAYLHLGYIIGEEMKDDLVDEIFSKFCMGK